MIEIIKKLLDFMIHKRIITEKMTGKIILEINVNQGGVTEIKVMPEWRFK